MINSNTEPQVAICQMDTTSFSLYRKSLKPIFLQYNINADISPIVDESKDISCKILNYDGIYEYVFDSDVCTFSDVGDDGSFTMTTPDIDEDVHTVVHITPIYSGENGVRLTVNITILNKEEDE